MLWDYFFRLEREDLEGRLLLLPSIPSESSPAFGVRVAGGVRAFRMWVEGHIGRNAD